MDQRKRVGRTISRRGLYEHLRIPRLLFQRVIWLLSKQPMGHYSMRLRRSLGSSLQQKSAWRKKISIGWKRTFISKRSGWIQDSTDRARIHHFLDSGGICLPDYIDWTFDSSLDSIHMRWGIKKLGGIPTLRITLGDPRLERGAAVCTTAVTPLRCSEISSIAMSSTLTTSNLSPYEANTCLDRSILAPRAALKCDYWSEQVPITILRNTHPRTR